MTRSNNKYRTAVVAPTAGDSIREAHSYEYDNNGNIVYVNTSRVKPDMTTQPDTVQRAREERFRWDEENRLTALSQNGYVSHYWYDADGERTVKMHGGNMAVFVNSERDGRSLDSQQTTAYFSPYFSIHEGRFTKHLYIGSERIASMTDELKPGDVSNSPAGGYNISHAGYGVDVTQLNIPYAYKCAAMRDSAEANYAHFGLPNALDGQTRQLREFVLPAGGDNEAEAPALRSGDKDNYNGNIWFIHSDHLGSSTLVTDGNGEASQQVEYLPYGEVFLERQNGDYATPYKFNGKELNEETGLYYYGARYMNPRLSIWYGCDPLQEKYPDVSTYCYTFSNPIRFIDEYGDKPQKSRIEYRGNGIFGININSLSAFSRNDFKRRNNDPRNWTPGEIGINTTVAKLLTITEYTSLTTNSDYSAAGVDQNDAYLKTRAELAKSTGLPDKRVRSHEVFALGSCNSKSIKGSAAFMIMLNVAAVALDYYVLFSANSDYEAIINQKIQLQSAMDAVLKYMEKNDIPSKYRDKHNLGAIINYVFQGENFTGDQRISEFGKLILKANGRYDKNSNQYVPFIQK